MVLRGLSSDAILRLPGVWEQIVHGLFTRVQVDHHGREATTLTWSCRVRTQAVPQAALRHSALRSLQRNRKNSSVRSWLLRRTTSAGQLATTSAGCAAACDPTCPLATVAPGVVCRLDSTSTPNDRQSFIKAVPTIAPPCGIGNSCGCRLCIARRSDSLDIEGACFHVATRTSAAGGQPPTGAAPGSDGCSI